MISTNSHLSVREKIAYGLGDTASNFYFQFFNLFLLFYYTDVVGLKESALDVVIRKSYSLLGLISFLTTGDKETRAWTIKRGSTAQSAAGAIHADFERGFIRAEIVAYEDMKRCGSYPEVKKHGLMRLEGKTYIVQDGDVVIFRFNV